MTISRLNFIDQLLRSSIVVAYVFIGLSCFLFLGALMDGAFLTTFTVENRLSETIHVTPVGTVGPNGLRDPLPVSRFFVVAIPSTVRGRYELQPNEKVSITYDMDDINFSEIVVENDSGPIGQLIVNPNPTAKQYHAPAMKHFVVEKNAIVPVTTPVLSAATRARQRSYVGTVMLSLLVTPWPIAFILLWLKKRHSRVVAGSKQPSQNDDVKRCDS